MRRVLAIAMAVVMAAAIAFAIGYTTGKTSCQPAVWIDETGEAYRAK